MTESKSSSKCHAGKSTSELLFPPPLETQLHCESSPLSLTPFPLRLRFFVDKVGGEYSFFSQSLACNTELDLIVLEEVLHLATRVA